MMWACGIVKYLVCVPVSGIWVLEMKEAWKRQGDAQMPARGLMFRRSPAEGNPSKRAGAHSIQIWSRYRGAIWSGNLRWVGNSGVESTIF
jgi:hypothetical protein